MFFFFFFKIEDNSAESETMHSNILFILFAVLLCFLIYYNCIYIIYVCVFKYTLKAKERCSETIDWCIHDYLKYVQICSYQLCNAPLVCHLLLNYIFVSASSVILIVKLLLETLLFRGKIIFLFFMSSLTINTRVVLRKTRFSCTLLKEVNTHNAPRQPTTRK